MHRRCRRAHKTSAHEPYVIAIYVYVACADAAVVIAATRNMPGHIGAHTKRSHGVRQAKIHPWILSLAFKMHEKTRDALALASRPWYTYVVLSRIRILINARCHMKLNMRSACERTQAEAVFGAMPCVRIEQIYAIDLTVSSCVAYALALFGAHTRY